MKGTSLSLASNTNRKKADVSYTSKSRDVERALLTLESATVRTPRRLILQALAVCLQARNLTTTGVVKYVHDGRTLMVDCDRKRIYFPVIARKLRELQIRPYMVSYEQSSSVDHWHIVIRCRGQIFHPLASIFVQLYLGSDAQRERFNFIRAYHHKRTDPLVQVLFSRKLSS